jgi:arsenate reductase-like glutaredoxin family protein
MSCTRAQEFLAKSDVDLPTPVDAKKIRLDRGAAIELARQIDDLYAAKGKKVVHFDLKEKRADDEALAEVLLGPTGNLRAPALRIGRTLIVGFDESTYRKLVR